MICKQMQGDSRYHLLPLIPQIPHKAAPGGIQMALLGPRIDCQLQQVWNNTYPVRNYRPRDIPSKGNKQTTVPMLEDPEVINYLKLYF